MKIWLDDERDAPNGWTRCRTVSQAKHLTAIEAVEVISLDHDLGEDELTGYDYIAWLEEKVISEGWEPPLIRIHTANPVGRKRMELARENILRYIGCHDQG